MTNRRTILLAGLVAVAVPVSGMAQSDAFRDDLIYYEIGGASLRPPAGYGHHARIRGDASLSLGYSCGEFDLSETIRGMFGRLGQGLDRAASVLTAGATGALSALPMYLLRQANPNLANMLENQMLRFEEQYQLSVKSCREAEQQILAGENPYYDWVSIGQTDTWRRAAARGTPVDEIPEEVDRRHGCVTWIDADDYWCDDSDNRVIEVVGDVAGKGYEEVAGADGENGDPPPGAPPSRLTIVWGTRDDAVEDILDLVGETTITNVRTTPPSSRPPRGAGAILHEDAAETAGDLNETVESTLSGQEPTPEQLAQLGVPGLTVTPTLIWALGNLSLEMRQTAIERISVEIALLRTMEKIILARRLLLAGSHHPAVQASPAADIVRDQKIRLLEMEYQLLKDEYEVRQQAASSTAAALMRHARAGQAAPVRGSGGIPGAPASGGAVRR